MDDIDTGEVVYRRCPVKSNFYKPSIRYLSAAAFRPNRNDMAGISFSRARYFQRPEDAAKLGYTGEEYWIIELRVSDLLGKEIAIVSDPVDGDDSHALIPAINYANLRSAEVDDKMEALRNLPRVVHGPFFGSRPRPPK